MTRIDGTSGVNNNIQINLSNVKDNAKVAVNSTFGDGFAVNSQTGWVSTDSRFEALTAKFDFEAPSYQKGGFAQFNPSEADFEAMKHLDAVLDKPETMYSEV